VIVDWIFFLLLFITVLDMSKIRNNIDFYALLVFVRKNQNIFSLIYCSWQFFSHWLPL